MDLPIILNLPETVVLSPTGSQERGVYTKQYRSSVAMMPLGLFLLYNTSLLSRYDHTYEMRCLFLAVGLNARFIALPHWDNMS